MPCVVGNSVVAPAKDMAHIAVCLAVHGQATDAYACGAGLLHGMARVFDQVAIVMHVDVGGCSIGDHQQMALASRLGCQQAAGVAQGGAQAGGMAPLQCLQPGGRCCGKGRSEEHTSELQSHLNLVCRLLLEKKKKTSSTTERTATLRSASTLPPIGTHCMYVHS